MNLAKIDRLSFFCHFQWPRDMSMCSQRMVLLPTSMENSSTSRYWHCLLIKIAFFRSLSRRLNEHRINFLWHHFALFLSQDIAKFMGEDKLQRLINFALKEMSELTLPSKRLVAIKYHHCMRGFCSNQKLPCSEQRDIHWIPIWNDQCVSCWAQLFTSTKRWVCCLW